ncbi:DUF6476 family protein [Aestuariivirga sp.]|uniref:DUF6476 family protein n=1 Tax=Aestuariivirga sp. TaxID=2650926 RepID=UPI0039E688B9
MTETDNPQTAGLPPGARMLLRAVYIMGVILVLLVLALIIGIVWKASHVSEKAPTPAEAAINLGLPAGESVSQVALDGDRLAVTTSNQIIIVDIRKNQIISRLKLKTP